MQNTPFRISTLVFIRNSKGQLLLLKRSKAPNLGKWSPIGGKLDFSIGESPFECATRETFEEVNMRIDEKDLRLFAYISEKNYEGSGHWLMFLFDCLVPLNDLPIDCPEGIFGWFDREDVNDLKIPETDHLLVWPIYDKRHGPFAALRADFSELDKPNILIESSPSPHHNKIIND
jgi:8-oxo-dGTP diphosphatase